MIWTDDVVIEMLTEAVKAHNWPKARSILAHAEEEHDRAASLVSDPEDAISLCDAGVDPKIASILDEQLGLRTVADVASLGPGELICFGVGKKSAETVAKTIAEWRRWRYKETVDACAVCDQSWRTDREYPRVLDVHEIARGPARQRALRHRAAWLLLCRRHHEKVQSWPVAKQLALKMAADPAHYDREAVCELMGRTVTDTEVAAHFSDVTRLRSGRT